MSRNCISWAISWSEGRNGTKICRYFHLAAAVHAGLHRTAQICNVCCSQIQKSVQMTIPRTDWRTHDKVNELLFACSGGKSRIRDTVQKVIQKKNLLIKRVTGKVKLYDHHIWYDIFNPLNSELNPICYLLALLGAHHFLHVSRMRVKLLTFRLLMSYIYIWSTHSWCF